jgi:hypothetical protein
VNYYAKNKNGSNFNHIQEKFQEPKRTIIDKKNGKIIIRQWKKNQQKRWMNRDEKVFNSYYTLV